MRIHFGLVMWLTSNTIFIRCEASALVMREKGITYIPPLLSGFLVSVFAVTACLLRWLE